MAHLAFSMRSLLVVFFLLNCLAEHHKSEALILEEEFAGKLVTDLKINLRADDVWSVYRKPKFYDNLSKYINKYAFSYYESINYITGKGGVGSIVNTTLLPIYGGSNWIFEVVELNDKTRTRVERHLKGEHFDSGFTSFETRYTVIEGKNDSCIIRQTTAFKIQEKSLSNVTDTRVLLSWVDSGNVARLSNKRAIALTEEYSGRVQTEMKVNLPAAGIWNVFRSKDFSHLIRKLMPRYYKQLDYVTGDGRVGTVLNITLYPEAATQNPFWSGSFNWLEKIIKIDDDTMTRSVRPVQGYYLDYGLSRFETVRVIPKAPSSCVIRAVIGFKVGDTGSQSFASDTNLPSWATAMTIANYVNSKKIKG